ncbi:hypothetical protein [Streptococcus suis]
MTGMSENPAVNKDCLKAKVDEAPDVRTGKDYTNATDAVPYTHLTPPTN